MTYGSDIKIKILDAIVAGCPVFATAHSLRGFDFMNFAPTLFVDDPEQSARAVAELVGNGAKVAAARAAVREGWTRFQTERAGKLGALIATAAQTDRERG